MKNAPNCYDCQFRKCVPGDTHSCCSHPGVKELTDNPILGIASILTGKVDVTKMPEVTANMHGVKMGWFQWPFNFDPAWLETCSGFQQTK